MKLRKAVIPAAGLGTRLLPATKILPKELLPIVDRPALEIILDELVASGIEEVVLVISRDKEAVVNHVRRGGPVEKNLEAKGKLDRLSRLHALLDKLKIHKAYQDKPLGLGHAVLCAQKWVEDGPFAVILPDDLVRSITPCLQQIAKIAEEKEMSAIAVTEVPAEEVSSYGMVGGANARHGKPFRIQEIVEKPPVGKAPSRWAIIGRYVLDPSIFGYLKEAKAGALGEIQLTDALAELSRKKGVFAVPFEGLRIDTGQALGYLEANLRYGLDRPELTKGLRRLLGELMK